MSNLTGRPVTPKNAKPKRIRSSNHWAAEYGTDEEFQAFVRKQPSCVTRQAGDFSPVVFAHFRGAFNSGVGTRPEYSGIPLTWNQHSEQHRVGQYNFASKEWWQQQVEKHLRLWIQWVNSCPT